MLDICVALTERADEAEMMKQVVRRLAMSVEAPLVIDTTEPEVMEAALKSNPGRSMLNSINLEVGREKIDHVLPLAVEHGAAVIALTIDEEGMAKTVERKLEVAKRIYDICVDEYGLSPQDLVFDALTFTLATGDQEFSNSAIETIEGIRRIKAELPGVLTSLGVSNVSFGLSPQARPVLNSVMLYHCVRAGLDMAIVNPAHIKPYAEIPPEERELVEDLIFNRPDDALPRHRALRTRFRSRKRMKVLIQPQTCLPKSGCTGASCTATRKASRTTSMKSSSDTPRKTRPDGAVTVLNKVLLPAMKEVGDKFGAGELILPFVLQSAEVMKKAVAHLEGYLERRRGRQQGDGRAGHGLRRCARHRQEPGQDHPLQQRLHRPRPGQASAGRRSSSTRPSRWARCHRLERPAGQHQQANAADRQRTAPARAATSRS